MRRVYQRKASLLLTISMAIIFAIGALGATAANAAAPGTSPWNPPELPGWYEPLPQWAGIDFDNRDANKTAVGLLDGWTWDMLTPMYGPERTGAAVAEPPAFTLWVASTRPHATYGNGGFMRVDTANPGDWRDSSQLSVYDEDLYDTLQWVSFTPGQEPWRNLAGDHNEFNTLGGQQSSWVTARLKWGKTQINDAYIAADAVGRGADGYFVIENKLIYGGLLITTENVIVRNCVVIACGVWWGGNYVDQQGNGSNSARANIDITGNGSAIITNCVIDSVEGEHAGIWHDGTSLVAAGNDIRNTNDGIFSWGSTSSPYVEGVSAVGGSNFLVQDNWIHSLTTRTSNGHVDGWQSQATRNGWVKNNYFDLKLLSSGNIALYGGSPISQYVMFEGNLFQGSGFTIYAYSQGSGPLLHIWFLRNVFSNLYSPNIGSGHPWYPNEPNDGITVLESFDWATFDPANTPSFHYGNFMIDDRFPPDHELYKHGESLDNRGPFDPQVPPPGLMQPGDMLSTGEGTEMIASGRLDFGRSYKEGKVYITFRYMPLGYPVDSGMGYVRTGMNPGTGNSWPNFNMVFGARPNGVFAIYEGNGIGGGRWGAQTNLDAALPNPPAPAEAYSDFDRALILAGMTDQEIAAIPYVYRYKAMAWYDVRIAVDLDTKQYSAWVRELDANEAPVESWFCIGEDFYFRNMTTGANGNDITAVYAGAGLKGAFLLRDHVVTESPDYALINSAIAEVDDAGFLATEAEYTAGSWADVMAALADAHVLLDSDAFELTQGDLDGAADAIYDAIAALMRRDTAYITLTGPATVATGAGATATYTVTAAHMPTVSGIELEFEVDGNYLSSKEFTALGGFRFFGAGSYGTPIHWKNSGDIWTGKVTLLDLDANDISGATGILNMVFNVPEGMLGSTAVKLNYVKVSYGSGAQIDVEILDGSVTTVFEQYYSPYDLNKDGVVDLNDLTFALQFLLVEEGDPDWEQAKACDFYEDKIIDIQDLVLILANYTIPYYG